MPDPEECPTVVHFERWREGDDSAFEALYTRFTPLLRARVQRHRAWPLLEGRLQVEDVLQEFWTRALPVAKEKFEHVGPGSLLGFLGTIVDREVTDLARRQHAKKRGGRGPHTLETSCEPAQPGPLRAPPETPTSRARVGELVQMARQELSARELEAWELVEIEQYTTEEAGVALCCSGSAVRGLLMRGRAKLIARLGRDGRADPFES